MHPARRLEGADVEVRGVFIEDTFAEAFGMRGGAAHHHGAQRTLGA